MYVFVYIYVNDFVQNWKLFGMIFLVLVFGIGFNEGNKG